MLNRIYPASSGRVLPPRYATISMQSSHALSLRSQIWFTPETVIWDAIYIAADLILLWQIFRRTVRLFAVRAIIVAVVLFLLFGAVKMPHQVAANTPVDKTDALNSEDTSLQINSQIAALEAPIFTWPIEKTYISSPFTNFHKGIDVPNPYSAEIKPLAFGEVIFADWDGGFGKTVIIRHSAGYTSRYSHLSNIAVHLGQKIDSHISVGNVGTTGVATGSHLHFEVYKEGYAINPLNILP